MRKANLLRCETAQNPSLQELFCELSDVRFALSQAYTRFNSTVEPELIDASIYEINAIESRYNYLLRILKQQEATAAYKPLTEGVTTWI